VATRLCPVCGSAIPDPSVVCERCGSRIPPRWRYRFVGRYNPPRFQIDPSNTTPQRDLRWVALVLGVCALAISGVLLSAYAVIGAATSSSGGSCGSGTGAAPCFSSVFVYLFLVPGLVLLVVGLVAVVGVLRQIW
jgi:hypothetical protein